MYKSISWGVGMTAKRCTDCKHTRGIGFDFWCGEGHTEYEVFGAETNCPYYEYHDWSKGVPSRTAKRFDYEYVDDKFYDKGFFLDNGKRMFKDEVLNTLNELHEENERLKSELYAERTNTAEVINEYSMNFKRHSKEFSFMIDLAYDLGVDIGKLRAKDD